MAIPCRDEQKAVSHGWVSSSKLEKRDSERERENEKEQPKIEMVKKGC